MDRSHSCVHLNKASMLQLCQLPPYIIMHRTFSLKPGMLSKCKYCMPRDCFHILKSEICWKNDRLCCEGFVWSRFWPSCVPWWTGYGQTRRSACPAGSVWRTYTLTSLCSSAGGSPKRWEIENKAYVMLHYIQIYWILDVPFIFYLYATGKSVLALCVNVCVCTVPCDALACHSGCTPMSQPVFPG